MDRPKSTTRVLQQGTAALRLMGTVKGTADWAQVPDRRVPLSEVLNKASVKLIIVILPFGEFARRVWEHSSGVSQCRNRINGRR